ncbi:nucleoside deaminase [Pseudomonas silvicola]|nr:nucleoside deaminase [Pseudomonas silvicola]
MGNQFADIAALVADRNGNVIAEAGNNSKPPLGDPTQHAELVAVANAAKHVSPETLAACTLYTSAEPCCMCAGAVYWTGIGRVVYALSEHALLGLTGDHPENPTFSLPCREVFAHAVRRRASAVVQPPSAQVGNQSHPARKLLHLQRLT